MTTPDVASLQAYQWTRQPEADRLVRGLVDDFLAHSPAARDLAQRMNHQTGTNFFDWIDSLTLPANAHLEAQIRAAGFEPAPAPFADIPAAAFAHPDGMFPRILLAPFPDITLALKVESVADFLAAAHLSTETPIAGEPFSPFRRATIAHNNHTTLVILERHGWPGFNLPTLSPRHCLSAAGHLETFRMRARHFDEPHAGFRHTRSLIDAAIVELGVDHTCALFFAAEREYWQRRNHAAQVQKARQDRLGLGWANHDHHTYRSSRASFADLIAIFEHLGMRCRERFYAGREAGWGAQILEQPNAGIVVFADVDLAPEEVQFDFAHVPLAARPTLGTVGLWCGLHGEAFLQAGMHHLECQFDFAALTAQLKESNVGFMAPFTDLPHLRQAFSQGERWPVAEANLQRLLAAKLITTEQAERFRKEGAIGSHLENLERKEGYKGFNQKGINEIIAATDPRHQPAAKSSTSA